MLVFFYNLSVLLDTLELDGVEYPVLAVPLGTELEFLWNSS